MVPLMALILLAGLWRLTNVGESRDVPLDGVSVVLSAFAFGGLVYGLSSIEKMLTGGAWTEILISLVGVVALIVFIRRQQRLSLDDRALMDLRPFRIRNFTLAVIILLISFGLMLGMVTVLPIYLQTCLLYTSPSPRD